MKGFDQLNKAFESRVRLGLMSILSVNSWVSYKEIKDLLEVTDGNLASHVQSLEKIKKDTDRDFYMTADEAITYGLADSIVDSL